MFLTDTHCHINKEYYPGGLAGLFQRAAENGVRRMLFASADITSSLEARALAENQTANPEIYATAGVHPHEAEKAGALYLDELEKCALSKRVSAIGEIGLDYFYDISPRDIQRRVFCEQLELAKKINKPVVIHVRDAKERADGNAGGELLEILKDQHAETVGGELHCFSGTQEDADAALELGFYISFAGPLTYPKNTALREIAMTIPADRLLCETDSPYLAPQGFRGKTNEPCHVRSVYEYLSMLKGMPLDEFADIVKRNGEKLFGWSN